MSTSFKYRKLETSDTASPALPITLVGNITSLDTFGIIDSGSTLSVISSEIADIIGVNRKNQTTAKIIGGGEIRAYETSIKIKLTLKRIGERIINLPFLVLDGQDEVILGRQDFFNLFRITFLENEKRIILQEVSK